MTPADLAAASLRATPLLAAVLVACAIRRRSSPSLRHAAFLLGIASLALMPWIGELPVSWTVPSANALAQQAPTGSAFAEVAEAASASEGAAASRGLVAFLAAAGPAALAAAELGWAFGTTALLLRIAVGLAGLARLRRRILRGGPARPIRFGRSRSRVAFCVSSDVDGPLTIGYLRPLVVLPLAARRWSRAQRRAVLGHEFAHVQRGDAWSLLGACVVRGLHWPNPLVWLTARRARAAAEEACDEAAVHVGRGRERSRRHGRGRGRDLDALEYAHFLLGLAQSKARRRSGLDALIPAITGRVGLAARLERLVSGPLPSPPPRPRARRMRWIGTLATIVLAAALLGTGKRADPDLGRVAARYAIDDRVAAPILRAAREEKIEVDLAFALVSVESEFDGTRVSDRGAVGLTQILPETASTLDASVTPDRLRDPETNARLGFRLLRSYLDEYQSEEEALLAYNLGPRGAEMPDAASRTDYPARVLAARNGPTERSAP